MKEASAERQIARIICLSMLDSLQELKSKNQELDIEEVMYCLMKEIEADLCLVNEQRAKRKPPHWNAAAVKEIRKLIMQLL